MNDRVVFCRIGWAEPYVEGTDDLPAERGKPADGQADSGNFLPIDGTCFGHVELKDDRGFDLRKAARDRFAFGDAGDILVVWYATDPKRKEQVVVGWYQNATAYSRRQWTPRPGDDAPRAYECRCAAADAYLLPPGERTFVIPRAKNYTGQANVWYADKPKGLTFLQTFRDYYRIASAVARTAAAAK